MENATLTRAELTEAVHEELGLTRQDCSALIVRTLDLLVEAMERGRNRQAVELRRLSGARQNRSESAAIPGQARRRRSNRAASWAFGRAEDQGQNRALVARRRASVTGKSPEAFRSISEAAAELGVEQHVLRFWESQLPFIRPLKRGGWPAFLPVRAISPC